MNRLTMRVVAVVLGALALLVVVPGVASAHPLGNFTVNRYSGVVVSPDSVTVDHVLDIAEIPTAQRSPAIDTSGDGVMSRPELAAWAVRACTDASRSLQLTVDGLPAALAVRSSAAQTLAGQAGLPTLRLECSLSAPASVTSGAVAVRLTDTGAGDEVGWREMTARGDGTTLARSDVPRRTQSARLTAYPKDLLSSPLDIRSLRLSVTPGGPRLSADSPAAAVPAAGLTRGADRLTLAFEGLLTRTEGNPWLGVVAVLAALALGAGHAVAPGHGKTIMAFYLSGRREGALRSAATVGATVTVTHTAGVLVLGLLVSAGTAFVPARVYPWLSVVSGLLVVLVGLTLLTEPVRRHRPRPHTHTPQPKVAVDHATLGILVGASPGPAGTHPSAAVDHAPLGILVRDAEHDHGPGHDHPHGHGPSHGHGHGHPHGHPHGHSHPHELGHLHPHPHEPARGGAPSRRGLIAMGLAGGLLPSPSALLVLLGAVALGHAWFGVALVVAFGLGMAGTLAVVGLVVMRLRERAELRLRTHPASRFAPLLRIAPPITAVVVVLLGAALAWRGFGATGLL
jgi:ABC-type nickel/cobalt efflux system permease component RcnA